MQSNIDIPLISRNRRGGFSLIEIAIVLVVVGLVIGVIMVGRDLIDSARVRSVLTDIEKFNTATNNFISKYDCVPGDCAHVTKFFPQFPTCDAWSGSQDLGDSTCNGDGDGHVSMMDIGSPWQWWRYDETVLFWQHLSLAGLLEKKYSGYFPSPLNIAPDWNVPISRLENACYSVNSSYSPGGLYSEYPYAKMYNTEVFGNFIAIGNPLTYNGTGPGTSSCTAGLYSLPAIFAQNLDSKIDDGKPYTGKVQSLLDLYGGPSNMSSNSPYPGCINDHGSYGDPSTSTYDVPAEKTACQLFFKSPF